MPYWTKVWHSTDWKKEEEPSLPTKAKFLKLTERHAAFTDLTPTSLNEFISRIEVQERDQKRARYAIQHISRYFNYIGKFENEVTQLAQPVSYTHLICNRHRWIDWCSVIMLNIFAKEI